MWKRGEDEWRSEDASPLPGAGTQMSENKNSPERGGQKSVHLSAFGVKQRP